MLWLRATAPWVNGSAWSFRRSPSRKLRQSTPPSWRNTRWSPLASGIGGSSNHPFVQGNKRTASVLAFFFLERAGYRVEAREQAVLDLVNGVNEGKVTVEAAAAWFRRYTVPPAE